MINKFFWLLVTMLYKPFFGKLLMPSYIGKPIYISNIKNIFIGKKVRIMPGSRMEAIGKLSSIVFENNISVGQNLHIISAKNQKLVIGSNSTLSANVFITNVDHEYENLETPILEQPLIPKKTHIGENCFIGYGAVIQAGTILGKQCIVGSNSVVRGSFPDYCVIVGSPAKIVKRYDKNKNIWRRTDQRGEYINEST